MADAQAREIARGNIEANLSDAVCEDGPDSIFDSALTLAQDALHDAGCPTDQIRRVAYEIATCFAQP